MTDERSQLALSVQAVKNLQESIRRAVLHTQDDGRVELGAAISDRIFEDVCNDRWLVSGERYDSEDPEISGYDPEVWPVILVRESDGARFEVDVDIHVTQLPAVPDD